jgi:hypothetical protein
MLHSVYGMNPARFTAVASTLQRMEDDPEALERSRRRFDFEDPPPPYSSGTATEPPTPILRPQLNEHETEELLRRPLDYEELFWFRKDFRGFFPETPFESESRQESKRIHREWVKRDQPFRPLYRGPDLIGRAGNQREKVMIRHSIKMRWERLGLWNPKWGIPGRVNRGPNDDERMWHWGWLVHPRKTGNYHNQPWDVQQTSWPPQDEEDPDERAIRQHLERKGEWMAHPSAPSHAADVDVDAYSRESLITSRPWYLWKLEVEEEAIRLARPLHTVLRDREKAAKTVTARWKAQGDWKESWVEYDSDNRRLLPGWKWRHESPSPEPADPNEMDFSPSEIDALESIPPPTPPSPLPAALLRRQTPTEEGRRIFGALLKGPSEPGSPASAQPDGEQESGWTGAPAKVPITRTSGRSMRQRGASSISGQANRRGRHSTAQRNRQANATSPTLTQSTRISKPATGPRRSTRLAEKARLKESDVLAPIDASKATRKVTVKVARQKKTPKEPESPGCFSSTVKTRGRPRKVGGPWASKPNGVLKSVHPSRS